jgi:hypothetical protein
LLRAAMECEPLNVDECTCDSQPVAAAGMHTDAPIFVLNSDTRSGVAGVRSLIAKSFAHCRDRFFDRDQSPELFRPYQQRHGSPNFILAMAIRNTSGIARLGGYSGTSYAHAY